MPDPIFPIDGEIRPLAEVSAEAVRRRIRRRWEQRRAETGGRSEVFIPLSPRFHAPEKVLTPQEIYTIPARPAFESYGRDIPARPAQPRPPRGLAALRVRLVQPR